MRAVPTFATGTSMNTLRTDNKRYCTGTTLCQWKRVHVVRPRNSAVA